VNRGQKEAYLRDYTAAKKAGKPFFPYAVYKDLIVATLAVAAVIGLAIWHRVEIGEPVNPASTDFVPRPEWYFFFLFELLRIFKNQNALLPIIMATFIIPNILMVLLIATPFIDRGPERRIHRRPIALMSAIAVVFFLGYMTQLGANAPEGVGQEGIPLTNLDPAAEAGLALFSANGCASCHAIKGQGAPGPGPDLTMQGTTGRSVDEYTALIKAGPGVMPAFTGFTPEQYEQLSTLLAGLGTKYK
jgi:menaquinol-cytochrome c reductase cytochrome b/c subunit